MSGSEGPFSLVIQGDGFFIAGDGTGIIAQGFLGEAQGIQILYVGRLNPEGLFELLTRVLPVINHGKQLA